MQTAEIKQAEIMQIEVPFPEVGDAHLRIGVGACRLRLVPGDTEVWAVGTYQDPSGALPCRVVEEGGSVLITQDQNPAEFFKLFSGAPRLHLALGTRQPYTLGVESGASENIYDFGGLPLTRLDVQTGASTLELDFSAPNPQPMNRFRLEAGAGRLQLRNLANANFAEMRVEGGAAAFQFDFGGVLRRDARVQINTGLASVEIAVPHTTAAKIVPVATLGNVEAGDGFMTRDGAFWTPAALDGSTPLLTIQIQIALGSLQLRTVDDGR